MSLTASSTRLLEALPGLSLGRMAWYVLDPDGAAVEHFGFADGSRFTSTHRDVADGRESVEVDLAGTPVIATFDADAGLASFVQILADNVSERVQLESDMESMYASSLTLLEEAAMIGEVMPKLPTGTNERDIARMGLEALLVASSVEHAVYVKYDRNIGHCDTLVHIRAVDPAGVEDVEHGEERWFEPGEGLVSRVILGGEDAVIESVPPGGFRTGPERYASSEVIAVPVRYGDVEGECILGVLLIMDKRSTSYSKAHDLGSHETKMAIAIASMLAAVLGTRTAAELGKELSTANVIQQQILPATPAVVSGFDLAGRCDTTGAVGGDYFDYVRMADGRTLVVIADVSGHNLASGMLMVSARSSLRLLASKHGDLAAIFDDLAETMFADLNRTERFITAAGFALRPDDGRLDLVDAGHNDTLVYRAATQSIERISGDSTVLGFLPGVSHTLRSLQLEPGDAVLVYTDGITEATDAANEMFDDHRLESVFRAAAGGSAQEILDSVFRAVEDFVDSRADDDVTAVVVKRRAD